MVVQTHHALGDGSSLLQMLVDLCGGGVGTSVVMPRRSTVKRSGWSIFWLLKMLWLCLTAFYHCVVFPLVGPDDYKTGIQQLGDESKGIARISTTRLELTLNSMKAPGYTVNDILTAAIAGALRRYMETDPERKGDWKLPKPSGPFHCLMPLNLRGLSATKRIEEGNKISILTVPCPIGVASTKQRLQEVASTMRTLKESPEPFLNLWINTLAFRWFR